MFRFITLLLVCCPVFGLFAQTQIAAPASVAEICDNGFDDDADGYVDCYDADCGCFTDPACIGAPANAIDGRLAWRTTSTDLSWANVPLIANLNPQTDHIPEIIVLGDAGISFPTSIRIYQGDGSNANNPERVIVPEGIPSVLPGYPAVGDLDGDGLPELVVITKNGFLQIYRNYTPGLASVMELWLTSDLPLSGGAVDGRKKRLHLADFNGDGMAEIYAGNNIFQLDLSAPASLKLVLKGTGREGIFRGGALSTDKYAAPIAADMLSVADCNGDPDCEGLELVAGGTIYGIDLDLNDGDGTQIKAFRQLPVIWGDGYTAVADVDLDGLPDAVVSSSHKFSGLTEWGLYVYDKNGLKRFLPNFDRFTTNGGGLVNIANVYDDRKHGFAKDYPEMIVTGTHRLICFNLNAATLNMDQPWWWSLEVDDESGSTGCAVFDFNSDGLQEIVYHDESELRILYGGAAPFPPNVDAQRNWWKITTGSGTRDEYPVVADADGDGSAEIILTGQNTQWGAPFPSIIDSDLRVYKSNTTTPWSPCRPLWNQYNYNSAAIHDDLRIPAQQQKHWLEFPAAGSGNYPFNGHMAQSTRLNSKFQAVYPLPDASVVLDSFSLGQQTADLYVRVCNQGDMTLRASMPLRFYLSDPTQSAAVAHGNFYFLPQNIAPGACLQWKIQIPLPPSNQLWGVINDSGVLPAPFNLTTDFPVTGIRECNYLNNLTQFDLTPPPPGPCQSPTFLQLIGEPGKTENISALRAAPDGNLYLAGSKGDRTVLSKMTPDGAFLWTRSFITDPYEPITIAEIIVDSEGMIAGSGRKGLPEVAKGFAFRYDPVADQVLWAQQIDSDRPTAGGMLEKTPGGNYLLYQSPNLPDTTQQAEILELDRNTGQIVPAFARRYHFMPFKQALNALVQYNGALYGTGYVQTSDARRKMWLIKLDANTGDPVWTNASHHGWARPSNLTGTDLIVEDSSILTVYFGNDTSSSLANLPTRIFLQKMNLDGEIIWIHQYSTTGYPKEIAAVPDGYVILVFGGNYDRRLLKTDKNGNLLISTRIDNPPANFFNNGEQQNQIEQIGDRLFIADYATSNLGDQYTTLLKTNQNLELSLECSRYGPIQVTDSSFLTLGNSFPQFVGASPATQQALSLVFSPDTMTVRETCPNCPDSVCTDQPDITGRVDSIFCLAMEDVMINIKICNLGNAAATQSTYLNFYDKNPFKEAATLLHQVVIQDKPDSSSCLTFPVPLNPSLLPYAKIYTLTGVKNDVPTPISLDSFPFASGEAECNYANNLDSFEVQLPEIKKLDLGPDRTICQGEITNLDAGSGYVQYHWATGAITQTIGVATNGLYVVDVIDACGRKQYDTVRVTVFSYPKRNVKVVLQPGDSVIVAGTTYFGPATATDTIPALTGVCDTVVTYTILLDSLNCAQAESFLKTYDASTSRVLLSAKDGSIYIAGENANGTLLSKSDINGNLLWTRQIFDAKQAVVRVSSLIEDSEGMLVGCGNPPSGNRNFAFRYDPAMDQVLWFKQMDLNRPHYAAGIVEKEPGGNYLFHQYLTGFGPSAAASEILPLDRATGELAVGAAFHYDPGVVQFAAIMHQGSFYAVGNIRDTSATGSVSNGITKINPNTGAVLWAQQTPKTTILGRDIIIDTDGNIVTLSTKGSASEIWLQKTSPDGVLLWLRKYQPAVPPGPFTGMSLELLSDGHYAILGVLQSGVQSYTLVLAKIDKNGGVIWGKQLPQVGITVLPSPQLLAIQGNDIYFTYGASAPAPVNSFLLGKLDKNGNLGETCSYMQDLTIVFTPENEQERSVTPGFSTVSREATSPIITPPVSLQLLPYTQCSKCATPCDSIQITKMIGFYPGDTIVIDGTAYTRSDTVIQHLSTAAGCDSTVTNILHLILTNVTITCPANFTVTLPPSSTSTVVDYNGPSATTDCPDPLITLKLLQGPPIGGSFPQGPTQVCYEAANQCGIRDTCCFTITAQQPDPPCDLKTPPGCIRYELLNIHVDPLGQRRYRVRMTNTCTSPLEFAYIQLPNGVQAVSPKEGATYTAPGGNTYAVRNPNASPFYSIRYKASAGSLNNGKSDIFEYQLPQQSQPAYIHVAAKLADGSTSETHLNTFYCPVLIDNNLAEEPGIREQHTSYAPSPVTLLVRPNPTTGLLFLNLRPWQGQPVQMQVLNAQGQLVMKRHYTSEDEEVILDLPASLSNGLYNLVVQPQGGEKVAVRFVLER